MKFIIQYKVDQYNDRPSLGNYIDAVHTYACLSAW